MFDLTKPAVIDIGSNSVRLMLPCADGQLNHKELNSTVLSEGMAKTGLLSDKAMSRTAKTVLDFFAKAKASGYNNIAVFATAAVRNAANGKVFVELLAKNGIKIDVLSGEAEALCGYTGAVMSFCDNAFAVLDIGGASVELCYGHSDKILSAQSLPLGVHIIKQLCGDKREVINKYTAQAIQSFSTLSFDRLIAISGTATCVAAMALGLKSYNPQKVHSSEVTMSDIDKLTDIVFELGTAERIKNEFPVLTLNRASVIAQGLVVLKNIMTHIHTDSFTASETDNTEGYINLLFTQKTSLQID